MICSPNLAPFPCHPLSVREGRAHSMPMTSRQLAALERGVLQSESVFHSSVVIACSSGVSAGC